jgi:hypothetical protein
LTLLTILQDVCDEIGLPRPSTVISNTDGTVRQLLALSNRSGKMLAQRGTWEELTTSATITTIAAELQGAVETLLPGFNWYLYQTMWNRDTRMKVWGPLYPPEWQFLKAATVTGPFPDFRIQNKNLYMLPVPTAGQTIGLEYMSRNWCESSGGTGQEKWAADTDVGILSEDLLTVDLIWRFKAAKGFDYAEDFRQAEIAINNALARSGGKQVLNAGEPAPYTDNQFGVMVPDGSWNL